MLFRSSIFGIKLSDPLAIIGQLAAGLQIYWPFIMTGLIPVTLTIIFGRFFCGWICPATFLYELNTNLGVWLHNANLPIGKHHFDRRIKYLVLFFGLILSFFTGSVFLSPTRSLFGKWILTVLFDVDDCSFILLLLIKQVRDFLFSCL